MKNSERPDRPIMADVNIPDALYSVVDECVSWERGDIDADEWASAIVKARRYGRNGYEITKEIEDILCISPDSELVEILDNVDHAIDSTHRYLVKKWVSENNIEPTFKQGERISYREWTGVVNGFDLDQGRYLLKPDGEEEKFSQGGCICVNYEEARPASAAIGGSREMTDKPTITQADRDAAYYLLGGASPPGILTGREDTLSLIQALAKHREAAIAELQAALKGLANSVHDLIDNSEGVYGLHPNGEPAPWPSLIEGGEYESWLLALSDADAALAQKEPVE